MLAEKVLRKHVAIIHAYSLMSSLQRKIVNVLLYEAIQNKHGDSTASTVSVECMMSVADLMKTIHFNSNNTKYLKEAIDGLASLKIEWNLLKDKAPMNISFLNLRVLHGPPTFYQNGTFNFSFHQLMLDLVGSPSIYGTIDVDLQSEFESKYGHSLYENSTRFLNLKKTKIVQLDTFRKMLGVAENKYLSMRELNRNVIKPALEEVNDRSGFVVNLKNINAGRKVTGFEICVENKKKTSPTPHLVNNEDQTKLLEAIEQTFGIISQATLKNILSNFSEKYILEKLNYTKKRTKKEKTGFYPVAYFMSAIKGDYQLNTQLDDATRKQPEISDYEEKWFQKLSFLKTDLSNWRKNLESEKRMKNPNIKLVENISSIIKKCEIALEKHIKEKNNKCDNEGE